jgi:DNA-binding transcriptional LysR family regulator
MDVRQLRAIVSVVDHGSVTKAAQELHVAQPSLSQTIRSLEHELGVDLFVRVGRRLVLTPAGEMLLGPARQVLRDMDTVEESVAQVKGLTAGHLDVVAEPSLAIDPVSTLIGAFRTAYPGVTVRLAEPDNGQDLAARVADGRSEIGIAVLPLAVAPPDADALATEILLTQDVLLVRPPRTRLEAATADRDDADRLGGADGALAGERGADQPVPMVLLAGAPFIVTPRGTSTRSLLERALAAVGVRPVVAVETEQREALLPLVLAGAGSALLPRPLAELARRQGALVRELSPPLRRTVGLVYRRGAISPAALSPAARAFVVLARVGRSIPEANGQEEPS